MDHRQLTNTAIRRVRERQAKIIQKKFYYQTPRKRGQSALKQNLKSQQHDEFAILNYYKQVSKYDLDRGNLNMKDAWKEKQFRRIENARAKREMIDNQIAKERHQEVVNKVQRIRELSVVKDTAIKERRNNALRHQEILREFLAKENNNKVDERPLSHIEDRSASGYRQSENTQSPIQHYR